MIVISIWSHFFIVERLMTKGPNDLTIVSERPKPPLSLFLFTLVNEVFSYYCKLLFCHCHMFLFHCRCRILFHYTSSFITRSFYSTATSCFSFIIDARSSLTIFPLPLPWASILSPPHFFHHQHMIRPHCGSSSPTTSTSTIIACFYFTISVGSSLVVHPLPPP